MALAETGILSVAIKTTKWLDRLICHCSVNKNLSPLFMESMQ
jgi:hypothetical protein